MDKSHQISFDCKWQHRLKVTHANGHIAVDDSHFISTSGHTCRRGSGCRERQGLVIKIFCSQLERTGIEGPCIKPLSTKSTHTTGNMDRGAQ